MIIVMNVSEPTRRSYPEVGQLEGHLNEGVRADLALLHEPFAVGSMHVYPQVHVIAQLQGCLWGKPDCLSYNFN